ncbi:O-antigen ligase [uncultured Hydrogenophaga sp.]|uniref:O-antigen ligase family protein n=1 Tax=uncultured Hydrogenophaga sp. TaxID=199683 RepID=UPI00265F7415|nr:O-antigen ligase family protein [uncultured Hydrogenophaga sp.]
MSDTVMAAPDRGWLDRTTAFFDGMARWSAVGLLIGVPTSIALVNISILFLLIGWVGSGRWQRKWAVLKASPLTLPVLLLSLWMLLGIAWSDADRKVIGSHLYVYSKLPLMLVLLTVFDEARWRQRAWWAFAVGCLITLGSTYASIWVHIPWADSNQRGFGVSHHIFNDYIAQGLAMSVFIAWAISRAVDARQPALRWGWALIAALGVFSVTHLLEGRTGQVTVVAMGLAMVLTIESARVRWAAVLLLAAGAVVLAFSSPLIVARVTQALAEARQYDSAGVVSTSIGARLDMWRNAWTMFLDNPWIGHGPGGYRVLSTAIYSVGAQCSVSCIHPHNQYLFFMVDHGIPGLLLYLWVLGCLAALVWRSHGAQRALVTGFLAVLFVDGFINGPFWVTTERHLFASVLPLLLAGWAAATARGARSRPA